MTTHLPHSLQKLLEVTVGMPWPEGDEDELWRFAASWETFANELDGIASDLLAEAAAFDAVISGQSGDALHKTMTDDLHGGATQLRDQAEVYAKALKNAAADIQKTKIMIIGMLAVLAVSMASLIASLFGSFAVPAVVAAARVGIGALLRALLVRLVEAGFFNIAKQIAFKTLIGAGVGAGLMVGLDSAIQGVQIAQGHRDGFDKDALKGDAIGGAIAGGLSGLAEGIGGVVGKAGRGLWDQLPRSLRAFRVMGNSILQIPAAALSNPLTNVATHQSGNVSDGILGALEGGGGHSHVHVPNLDVHPLNIAHVPALPAFPHSGETTTTPVTRGHTPIGSTFTTPVRETPVATTGAAQSTSVERMAPKGNASSSRAGAPPVTTQTDGHAGTDGRPAEQRVPGGRSAADVRTSSGEGNTGNPQAASEVAPESHPGQRQAVGTSAAAPSGRNGGERTAAGNQSGGASSSGHAVTGSGTSGGSGAAQHAATGEHGDGRVAGGSQGSLADGRSGAVPQVGGERGGSTPLGDQGVSRSAAGGRDGAGKRAAAANQSGGASDGGRAATESGVRGGSGAGQHNVVENHGGGASGEGDGRAEGVRPGVVSNAGVERGGSASVGNRGVSGAADGGRSGAGQHAAAGNRGDGASGSGSTAAESRVPGVGGRNGVGQHNVVENDGGGSTATAGGKAPEPREVGAGHQSDGAPDTAPEHRASTSTGDAGSVRDPREPGSEHGNTAGPRVVAEDGHGGTRIDGETSRADQPPVLGDSGHRAESRETVAGGHSPSETREQGVSDRHSVPAEPPVSGEPVTEHRRGVSTGATDTGRGTSGGDAPTESGHGATESRGSEAGGRNGAGQRVATDGGRASDPQTQDVARRDTRVPNTVEPSNAQEPAHTSAGSREPIESQAHAPAAEPQVTAEGQRGDTPPADHSQQRHTAVPGDEPAPAAGSHGVDGQPTGHPHPNADSHTATVERSDHPANTGGEAAATRPAVESADGPRTSATHAELSGTGPGMPPTEHGAEPHHSVEQPPPSGEIHQEHPVQQPHPEPDPTPPSPANRVEQARTERPKVDGNIDGQAVRESVLGLLDLGNSRSDQVLRTLVEQHFSDENLKETFHRAVDGGVIVDLGARNAPQVRLEVVGLSTPRDVRVESTDFSAARTREPASTSTTNARTAVSTESRGFRIPTPFVSVAVKVAGLVNVRGSDVTSTVKHAGETTVVESNVPAHRSTQDVTYEVKVLGPSGIERTDFVSTEVPLLWRGDTVPTGEHSVLGGRIEHAELSGLGEVSRRVEEAFGRFPAGHAGAREFRNWVHGLSSSADDLLSGKPVRQQFKFPGRREPVEVSVSVADTVATHPAGTAEGKIERKSEVSAESSVGQSVARRWGGGVTISGGDVTGTALGGLANLAVTHTRSTTTETRATEKFGHTLSDTYRGAIGRHRVDFTYIVRAHDQVIKVDGAATVWTKDAEPGHVETGSGSVSARMLDRLDADHRLPEQTISHLVGPVLHRLSAQGLVRSKDLPQIERRFREFLNDNARELVRGGDGVRFPLSAWHSGAPDVFVRGSVRADEARPVGVVEHEVRGGRISTAHRDTVEVTRTKETSVGVTGSVYGSRLKGVGGSVGGEYKSTGRDVENVAHEVGHERTLADDRPLNLVRYPVDFEVRVGGRWAEPGEPLRWGDGTTLHGEVDVAAPIRAGQPLETPGGAAGPGPRPTWHDGEVLPADEREGFLPPGYELNSLRPVPDLLGTVTRMIDAPRSSRFAEMLRRPLLGAGPARFDEHKGLGRWGRDAGQADERNAARDVLESFASQPARTGRFERAALYHDTVQLKSHNRAGLVGSRERVARVDLAARLSNARIVRVDDTHHFSATEVTAAERTRETTTATNIKGKFDASFAPPVKGKTPTRPGITAGGGIGHLDQTANSVREGAKDTATRSRTERGYLVTFDATYTVHTSARRDWHDIAGFRHDGRTRDAAKWVRVPEAATMWVPASEIHRVGRLADDDVARLDPADAERYQHEHRSEPVDHVDPPVPPEPDPVAAPSTVGRGSGQVELHRLTAGTELLTEVATRLTHWAAQHERVPEPNILDLTRQAFGSTVPERPSRRSVEFGPINDRLVNDVLGPTLTGSEFTPALREMLNGGRPVFLEGATPFGKVEQLVVLRADLGPGAYHRRVAGETGQAETTATHRTADTTTRGWSFDFSGGLTAGTGANGKPSSSQGFSVNVSHNNRGKAELTRERSETVTAVRDGDTVEFLHDLRVTMDVYPYARSGHYRKYLPGARHLAEPWSTEFTLPGSVRSSVPSHETIPLGEHPTPPLAQADGSLRAWQRHRDLPRGLSDDVTMHVRPFDAPKLHKVLDDIARGEGQRPPLTPRAVHEIRSATGSLLRTHLRDLLSRDGHVVRGSGRRLAQVKVSADIVRRELVRVLDEPLKSKASEKETAKLTNEHAGEVGLATSANISALPISNATQRPSAPLHDASTKMREWSRTDTAESSTKKDLPDESAADRRYLVRLTPRWQVVPEYHGSKAQEAWSRPVRTGPDTPILVEVDERGLTQLGLADPERGAEAGAVEERPGSAGSEGSGSDTPRSRTLADILGMSADDVRGRDEGRSGGGENTAIEHHPERVQEGAAAEEATPTAVSERGGPDGSGPRTLGDILGLPAEDVRRHEDAPLPPADAAAIERQQAVRTPFGLEVIPEGDEGHLSGGEDHVPGPERVDEGGATDRAADDQAEIDRQIEAMWQRRAGRTPFGLDIIPEGDEGPSVHDRLRPADVVEGYTLTGVDRNTGAEATFHSSQARAHQLRTAAGTPVGISFSVDRGVAEDRRAIRHDHAGTTQLDHPAHEISETVAAPWPRNTLYVTTHGSQSGFHIRLTDGRELEVGGATFGRLLDDLRIFHRAVEHDRPDALALVVCDVGAVDGPGGAAHDFQRALRELGHRQPVVAATDAVGFQIDESRRQWSTYVDNGGRWRTFSGEPADTLAPRHAPPPPPATEHSATAPAEHHQDDPSVAIDGQHHEPPAETGEPEAASPRQPETGSGTPVDEAQHLRLETGPETPVDEAPRPETGPRTHADEVPGPRPQERANMAEMSQQGLSTSHTSSRSDHRPTPAPRPHRGGANYRDLPAHSGRKTELNRQRAYDEKHDGTAHDRRRPEPIQEPVARSSGPEPKVVRPRERVAADFAEALEKLGLRPYLSGGAALGLHGGLRPIGDLDFRVAGESGIHSFDEGGKGAAVLKSINETTLPGKVNEYRADLKKREVESGGQLDQLHAVDSGLTIGTDNWFGHEVSLAAVPGERPRTVSMSMGEAAKDRHIDVLSLEDLRADKAKTILTRTKHGEDSLKKVAQDLIDFLDASDLINRRPGQPGGDIAHHVDQGLKDRINAYKGANLDGANLHHLSDKQVLDLMKARLVETAKAHVRNGARRDAFHDIIRKREQGLQREIDRAREEGTSSSVADLERRLGEIRARRANLEEQLTKLSELPTDPAATHAIRPWMAKWNDRASHGPPPESRAVRGPAGAQGPRTMEPSPEPHPQTPVHDLLDLHAPDVTDRLHEVMPNASEHVEKVAKVLAFSQGFRELPDHKSEAQTLAAFDLTKTQFAKAFKDLAKAGLVEPSAAGLHLTEKGFQQLVPTTGPYRVPDPTHIRPHDVVPPHEHEPAVSDRVVGTRPAPHPGHGSDGAGPSDAHEPPAKRARHDDPASVEHLVSPPSLNDGSDAVHNSAFANLAAGPVPMPTREHYLDHLAASVEHDAPVSFVITSILSHAELDKLPAVLDGMMAGSRDLDGRVAFVFGVNAKAGGEAQLARSLAQATPVVHARREPVALVPLTWDGKSFPYGDIRNRTIDSPAGRWAVAAMLANGSHPYLAVQDFDAGSRAVPSGEHVFTHVAEHLRMGEGIAPARPLMISGGYRVSDHAELVRATSKRIDGLKDMPEAAVKELRKKVERPDFAAEFSRLIDEDMRTRQRQVGAHPLLPYTPEPNLFVDGLAVMADPTFRFGRGAAEYTNLGRAANRLYADELSRIHGAELDRAGENPDHRASVEQQANVDAQNNRHPLRGEAFTADFVDGAIETDLSRLALAWVKDGKLPQSHLDLTTVVNRFFGGDNPQADRAAKRDVSLADYRKAFPKKEHAVREPQRPDATWNPSGDDGRQLGNQGHNTLNQAISTPLSGELGFLRAGVPGEHKLIAAHHLATSDVATAMARALGSIKNDVLPGARPPAPGSLYHAVDPANAERLRAQVLHTATGSQPKVVGAIGAFAKDNPIVHHGHLVNALVQHRVRTTDADAVENVRADHADDLAARLIATQLKNNVVIHHEDGTTTTHEPFTGKAGRKPVHISHHVDPEGRHVYEPAPASLTRPAPTDPGTTTPSHAVRDDESWRHNPADTADWFAPRSDALAPDQWRSRRDAAHVRTVDTEIADVTTDSTPSRLHSYTGLVRYDMRRIEAAPGRWVRDFTVKIHLASGDPAAVAAVRDKAQAGVDGLLNRGYRLPGGDQFHVTLEFTEHPHEAHTTVEVGNHNTDQTHWHPDADPAVLAHETLHYLGVNDEYRDPSRIFLSRDTRSGVVSDEHGMMGTGVLRPDSRLRPRHLWMVERVADSQVAVPDTPLSDRAKPSPARRAETVSTVDDDVVSRPAPSDTTRLTGVETRTGAQRSFTPGEIQVSALTQDGEPIGMTFLTGSELKFDHRWASGDRAERMVTRVLSEDPKGLEGFYGRDARPFAAPWPEDSFYIGTHGTPTDFRVTLVDGTGLRVDGTQFARLVAVTRPFRDVVAPDDRRALTLLVCSVGAVPGPGGGAHDFQRTLAELGHRQPVVAATTTVQVAAGTRPGPWTRLLHAGRLPRMSTTGVAAPGRWRTFAVAPAGLLGPDGFERWHYFTPDEVRSTPLVVDGRTVAVSFRGDPAPPQSGRRTPWAARSLHVTAPSDRSDFTVRLADGRVVRADGPTFARIVAESAAFRSAVAEHSAESLVLHATEPRMVAPEGTSPAHRAEFEESLRDRERDRMAMFDKFQTALADVFGYRRPVFVPERGGEWRMLTSDWPLVALDTDRALHYVYPGDIQVSALHDGDRVVGVSYRDGVAPTDVPPRSFSVDAEHVGRAGFRASLPDGTRVTLAEDAFATVVAKAEPLRDALLAHAVDVIVVPGDQDFATALRRQLSRSFAQVPPVVPPPAARPDEPAAPVSDSPRPTSGRPIGLSEFLRGTGN